MPGVRPFVAFSNNTQEGQFELYLSATLVCVVKYSIQGPELRLLEAETPHIPDPQNTRPPNPQRILVQGDGRCDRAPCSSPPFLDSSAPLQAKTPGLVVFGASTCRQKIPLTFPSRPGPGPGRSWHY